MIIEYMIFSMIIIKSNSEFIDKLKVISELNAIIKEKPFMHLLKLITG